jgi:alpha-D-xyloside xylohydrolase
MYFGPQNTALALPHSRSVYLPAKTRWIDFWTNKTFDGGQTIIADAPISHIPVFVKAGSIIPIGPDITYASQRVDAPLELRIYAGHNGKLDYYEDDGISYDYKKNRYARTTIYWNDKRRMLTISNRRGNFKGMIKKQRFRLVYINPDDNANGKSAVKSILYNGSQQLIGF